MTQVTLNLQELLNLSEFVRHNVKQHIDRIVITESDSGIGNTKTVSLLDNQGLVIAVNDITDHFSW